MLTRGAEGYSQGDTWIQAESPAEDPFVLRGLERKYLEQWKVRIWIAASMITSERTEYTVFTV